MAEVEARLPGLLGTMDPDHPGMHTTDMVDLVYVASGQLILELDEGVEVELKTGDTVVQSGTRHRWHNRDVRAGRHGRGGRGGASSLQVTGTRGRAHTPALATAPPRGLQSRDRLNMLNRM